MDGFVPLSILAATANVVAAVALTAMHAQAGRWIAVAGAWLLGPTAVLPWGYLAGEWFETHLAGPPLGVVLLTALVAGPACFLWQLVAAWRTMPEPPDARALKLRTAVTGAAVIQAAATILLWWALLVAATASC